MTDTVYILTSGDRSDYQIDRVYLDKAEAETFAEAHNKACRPHQRVDIEEFPVGVPTGFEGSVYDGPAYRGQWFSSWNTPGWNYTEDVIENGKVEQEWYTGTDPGKSKVVYRALQPAGESYFGPFPARAGCTIVGTSKAHVEKVLHDTVAVLKAELA